MNAEPAAASVQADRFDGRSARPTRVTLSLVGDELLIDAGEGEIERVAAAVVRWPERQRHGPRIAQLPDGGALHALDPAAWDAWRAAAGLPDPLAVRLQQSWRGVLLAFALLAAVCAAGYQWGLPALGRATVAGMPASVDSAIGERAEAQLHEQLLKPTALAATRREALQARFARAFAEAYPGEPPTWRIAFHAGRLGANAFALPNGTVVFTDDMVRLFEGDDDVLVGVFGHELGHLRHRHAMRALVQASALGFFTGLLYGDFSSVLATAPAVLGELGYSRAFEREADDEAIRVLRAERIDPAAMVRLFDRMEQAREHREAELGVAFATHPADDERRRRFREASASPR